MRFLIYGNNLNGTSVEFVVPAHVRPFKEVERMKVLIVDDKSHVRDAIQLLLEWEKYGFDTVLTADNVEDAINILQDERPELLIVDVVIEMFLAWIL